MEKSIECQASYCKLLEVLAPILKKAQKGTQRVAPTTKMEVVSLLSDREPTLQFYLLAVDLISPLAYDEDMKTEGPICHRLPEP